MPEPGSKVSVETADEVLEGILMPSERDTIVVKLKSGYNIGISKKRVRKIGVISKPKSVPQGRGKAAAIDKSKKRIVILHTGGTIASRVDYEVGGVIASYSAEDILSMVPEMGGIAAIETELVSNIMSEDIVFADYQKIASAVKKHAENGADGVIMSHGTDTLAFTSAALSFMFEKINIPVLVVGAQRSSDRGSTDAAMNLICAAEFIAKTDFRGVAICMHHSESDDVCAILPATKTRKMHTSRRDAFKAINDTPIALVDFETRKIEFLKKVYPRKSDDNNDDNNDDNKIVLKDKFEDDVGLIKTHPGMKPELFEHFSKSFKGFVVEGTGLGHAPTNVGGNLKNHATLKKFIGGGGIVAITSQCIYGRVHPYIYTNIRRLSGIGCIYCEDMLPETAFIKLGWLLGNYRKEEAASLMAQNLRGEISGRLLQ